MSANASLKELGAPAGVSPVLEVPFRDDGTVDETGFARVLDHVLGTGVAAVMFPGFASEFYKLSDLERDRLQMQMLQATQAAGVASIVSIPDHATHLAVDRARRAVDAGAQIVNVLPPHFLGPSADGVRAHITSVLEAIGPVPAILQYAPAQTGTGLDAGALSQLARANPNLRYVKVESTLPGRLITALAHQDPPLLSLVGSAGLQLPDALAHGAIGVQPGCSFTELYQAIWQFHVAGDSKKASALHASLLPYLSYWMQNVELIIAAEKYISYRRGLIDSAHCRAPGYRLGTYDMGVIDTFLDEFSGWFAGAAR
jgi:dihydrodipicolinate synthase/N-acetylneuraminate lyase